MTMINVHLDKDETLLIINALMSSKGDRGASHEERELAARLERELRARERRNRMMLK